MPFPDMTLTCPACRKYQLSASYCLQCGHGKPSLSAEEVERRRKLDEAWKRKLEGVSTPPFDVGQEITVALHPTTGGLYDFARFRVEPDYAKVEILHVGLPMESRSTTMSVEGRTLYVPQENRKVWVVSPLDVEPFVIFKYARGGRRETWWYQVPLSFLLDGED